MDADDKKGLTITTRSRTSSTNSSLSLKSPRAPRFAEATAVHSPIEPTQASRAPFADSIAPTNHCRPQLQPSDVGFGYIEGDSQRQSYLGTGHDVEMPQTPRSPLKSAMKTPGAPRNIETVLSPTFREQEISEKQEKDTEKAQAADLVSTPENLEESTDIYQKVKIRVRMAKIVLRGVNFSCSLIVIAMLATVFAIFNATRALPPRNGLPAWAPNSQRWPQITILVVACVSLVMSLVIFYAYWKGGHRRAEKLAVYYTTFAVAFFVFSIVMWGIAAGILHGSKANGNGKDIWGWSCKDNERKRLFEGHVNYELVCRLQNWSLVCCIIEVIVETITIAVYSIVFYRFYSKRKLRKSMAMRDTARSDLYLAQLRSQSAPNTPGYGGPMSPRSGGWIPPPNHAPNQANSLAPPTPYHPTTSTLDPYSRAEMGEAQNVQYASVSPKNEMAAKPFTLQPPPIRIHAATPRIEQGQEWTPAPLPVSPVRESMVVENQIEHVPAAPGEVQYAAVPIPGAYATPMGSPGFAPAGYTHLPHGGSGEDMM